LREQPIEVAVLAAIPAEGDSTPSGVFSSDGGTRGNADKRKISVVVASSRYYR
jgi:hypothetical protein